GLDGGGQDENRLVGDGRHPVLLDEDLDHGGDPLEHPEGPHAVGTVPVLPEPEQAPLDPGQRRLLGLWQDRYGPNRVGPFGVLQWVAAMIKIFVKQDWVPPVADKAVFILAATIQA